MDNIKNINNCYGCGVCALACPKNIIDLEMNADGFYEPHIVNEDDCIQCGLCRNVCAYINDSVLGIDDNVKCYAAWSKDADTRKKASTGGVGYEIASQLVNAGYGACVVRYNSKLKRVEHYIATDIDMLKESLGSKYLQSYTVDGFNSIESKQKYLVTGAPCQIASFRRYIKQFRREDNFILLDFFCHGVPSKLLWDKYLVDVEQKTGSVEFVSWRNKDGGWSDSYKITVSGNENQYVSSRFTDDLFFMGFLGDSCLNKSCYDSCKYKYDSSAADIRIGDMWGNRYKHDKLGVNAVIAFTHKGEDVLKLCNCEFIPHSFSEVAEGQQKNRAKRSAIYSKIMANLKDKTASSDDIHQLLRKHRKRRVLIAQITHPTRTIRNLVKRIFKK